MASPIDIPAAKRAGLPVDLVHLAQHGDGDLTPEQRYALKTHGVCTQLQDGVFMVRVRVPGGALTSDQARGLAAIARQRGRSWIHLTTRQNVELHWIDARDVATVLEAVAALGLSTRSSCGHTLRNVMCAEDAGVGADEPFDCFADARAVSDAIVARSAELNCVLPSRLNFAFGGSQRCRDDALLNDGGFVSVVRDGVPGYELWAGGSLGKAPRLAVRLHEFVPREHVVAAAEAVIDVFLAAGDFDHPAKARLKHVVERLGADELRARWERAYGAARERAHDAPVAVAVPDPVVLDQVLAKAPDGGWRAGVRPQRRPGWATVVVDVPLGDVDAGTFAELADLADRDAGGRLRVSRDQDVVLRDVAVEAVGALHEELTALGLAVVGSGEARIRACTGSAVCALGITDAPGAGARLRGSEGLARNRQLRVHVSGCPNSCAQHQVADLGLAGTRVKVGGEVRDGYQLFVGADLEHHQLGEVVGRVAEADAVVAVDAVIGVWEAHRLHGETLGRTCRRLGLDAVSAHLTAALEQRWAAGPEPDAASPDAASPDAASPDPASPDPVLLAGSHAA
jgi:sulfite reductase beta subunit-like hemoprotein